MSAITARLTGPVAQTLIRRGTPFSTTATPSQSTNATAPGASGWWKSLEPNTRRNVKIGLAVAAVADVVTLEYYFFPEWFRGTRE